MLPLVLSKLTVKTFDPVVVESPDPATAVQLLLTPNCKPEF